ncbi:MAG: TlpA disulfide reductase family protein [Pirellulaceae bacterium]
MNCFQMIAQGRYALLMRLLVFGFVIVSLGSISFAQPNQLIVTVLNHHDQPVAGATVRVVYYAAMWHETDFLAETNEAGVVEFEGIQIDGHPTLLIQHSDYAPDLHAFTLETKEVQTLTCTLAPARMGTFRILSPDGKPVSGAEITRLEVASDLVEAKSFWDHDSFRLLSHEDGSEFRSDEKGVLNLPALPEDAVVTASVTHPDWAVGKVVELKVSELNEATVELKPGVALDFQFSGSQQALEKLEGESVRIQLYESKDNRINHVIQVHGSNHHLTMPAGKYESLDICSPDLCITPVVYSGLLPRPFLDFSNGDTFKLSFVVREMHKVTGVVRTKQGTPVANEYVQFGFENLYVDETGIQCILEGQAAVLVNAKTDSQGRYEVELPYGAVSVELYSEEFIAEPVEFEFTGQAAFKDYEVNSMPTIEGHVVNVEGQPIAGAAVRWWTAGGYDEYVFADNEGMFSIKLNALDVDIETEKRLPVKTLAGFDLLSDLAGIQEMDVANGDVHSMKLVLTPHPADWQIQEQQNRFEAKLEKLAKTKGVTVEELKKNWTSQYRMGQAPPVVSKSWFNTDARSLEDFRGKFVLLDFWFIGCGPCEREMPNLKRVYEAYAGDDFTVLSIHIAGQSPETVKQFTDSRAIKYPLVVDSASEEILKAYRPFGVEGFPTYLLIDPDGNIVGDPSIRGVLLETVREKLLEHRKKVAETDRQ